MELPIAILLDELKIKANKLELCWLRCYFLALLAIRYC